MEDHPRGCGEHFTTIVFESSMTGSSPRMRGARHHLQGVHIIRGIIPADAGSTEDEKKAKK